jgi:hypothetical protein
VGPWAGLDTEARGKILCLCRGSNPCRSVCSRTLYTLSYPTFSSTYVKVWNRIHSWRRAWLSTGISSVSSNHLGYETAVSSALVLNRKLITSNTCLLHRSPYSRGSEFECQSGYLLFWGFLPCPPIIDMNAFIVHVIGQCRLLLPFMIIFQPHSTLICIATELYSCFLTFPFVFCSKISVFKYRSFPTYAVITLVQVDWLIDWLIDWLWWDETMSQNCGHQRVYCLSPGWYVSVESYDDDHAGWG